MFTMFIPPPSKYSPVTGGAEPRFIIQACQSAQKRRHELGLGDLGVGEAVEPAFIGIGQLAVVEAHRLEQSGLEVVDRNRINRAA